MTKLRDSYGVQLADMIARSTISEQWSDLPKDQRRQLKRQFLKAARRKLRRERRSSSVPQSRLPDTPVRGLS